MQRLKYVPVKRHMERSLWALYEFIPLPGGVTLWSTGALPYNGRSVRTLQQFEVHHWSGTGLSSDCTEFKLITSVTKKITIQYFADVLYLKNAIWIQHIFSVLGRTKATPWHRTTDSVYLGFLSKFYEFPFTVGNYYFTACPKCQPCCCFRRTH